MRRGTSVRIGKAGNKTGPQILVVPHCGFFLCQLVMCRGLSREWLPQAMDQGPQGRSECLKIFKLALESIPERTQTIPLTVLVFIYHMAVLFCAHAHESQLPTLVWSPWVKSDNSSPWNALNTPETWCGLDQRNHVIRNRGTVRIAPALRSHSCPVGH